MFAPGHDMYADEVYEAAKKRYEEQKAEGVYIRDAKPCYYIYEQTMDGRVQTGIAALSSVMTIWVISARSMKIPLPERKQTGYIMLIPCLHRQDRYS